MRTSKSLKTLSNNELVRKLERLSGTERELLVQMLRYLVEVERRELYSPRGYSSLHEFCTGHLKYSGAAASRRITAARCLRRYRCVAGMLLRGEINLSVLSLVADMLTPENYREVLSKMKGRSYRDVQRLVARHNPKQAVRDRVKPVYIRTELKITGDSGNGGASRGTLSSKDEGGNGGLRGGGGKSTSGVGRARCLESTSYGDIFGNCENSGQTDVVFEEKYELKFAVNAGLMEKIDRVRAILSTKRGKPRDFESLFEHVIDEFLDRHSPEGRMKRRAERGAKASKKTQGGAVKSQKGEDSQKETIGKTKKRAHSKRSRYIPQAAKDEVYMRDGGRCTHVGTNGKRCVKRDNLQIDHIVPYAKGGRNTIENLRLLCPGHNRLAAKKEFGTEHIDQYRRQE